MIPKLAPQRSNVLIMQLNRMGSLSTLLQHLKAGRLTIYQQQFDLIAWQMISGLTLIHKLGYQHRRMSPWNVLLFESDEFPQ